MWRASGSMPTIVAGLPIAPLVRPSSSTSPDLEQLLDHRRDGGGREPDELGEVGPRRRAAVMQRPQDQAAVRAAGIFRQHPRLAGEAIAERSAMLPLAREWRVSHPCVCLFTT